LIAGISFSNYNDSARGIKYFYICWARDNF